MNKYIKKAAALTLTLTVIFASGCRQSDGSGSTFKYDIPSNPMTLDPQTAYDSSSLEIISNLFQGLLTVDDDGDVVCAMAESYEVSEDGLVYSFKLKEDVYWYDGRGFEEKCTAKDFVFGFQRLFKPATKSKNAEGLYCIKNAESINKGLIQNLDELGVEAVGDYELMITLEKPNPSFPVLLTTSPAMPCNEEYYENTNGTYGLYAESVASNGAFYVSKWSYDQWNKDGNNIIMRVNAKNAETDEIYPYGLNFFIGEEDSYQNFLNEESSVYVTSGAEALRLLDMGYEYSESSNKVWGILFNTKSGAFKTDDLRRALAYSVPRDKIEISTEGYSAVKSIVPDIVKLGEESYRELAGKDSCLPYSNIYALNELEDAAETIDKKYFSGLTLYIPDDDAIEDYVAYIVQQWQTDLGFYCNVKRLDESSYETTLVGGDFDFIVADISGSFNSPYAYLSSFLKSSGENYGGYVNSSFEALMERTESAADAETSAELYLEAEKMITDSGIFIPLINQSEYAFSGKDCKDIVYNPFSKTVIFKDAKKF